MFHYALSAAVLAVEVSGRNVAPLSGMYFPVLFGELLKIVTGRKIAGI